jgi:hypothetical protein
MDGGQWSACKSGVTYSGLRGGGHKHTFEVRAVDASGQDSDPAKWNFTVGLKL